MDAAPLLWWWPSADQWPAWTTSSFRDGDDDLATFACGEPLERGQRLGQRADRLDRDPKLTLSGQLGDAGDAVRPGSGHHVRCRDAAFGKLLGPGGTAGRND